MVRNSLVFSVFLELGFISQLARCLEHRLLLVWTFGSAAFDFIGPRHVSFT